MQIAALEERAVSPVGYHALDDRPGFKMDLQVVDDTWYLYLSHFWHSGWSIVDVTDPANPTLENFISGPENTTTKQVQVADGTMVTSLERPRANGPIDGPISDPSEPYATGAYIWDVETNPAEPELLGHYDTGGRGTHRNYYAGGDYAFMCASPEGFEPTIEDESTKPVKNFFLTIVDVSNRENPVEVSRWMLPEQNPDERTDDVENFYLHGPAYVQGESAYLSYGRAGMVKIDVSDIESPELVYRMDFGEGLGAYNGVHSFIPRPETDIAVVNSEAVLEGSPLEREGDPLQYTFLVDISDDSPPGFDGVHHHGPRVVSTVPMPTPEDSLPYDSYYEKHGRFGPHNQHHPRGEESRLQADDLLFMTYFNAGLRIFDISDPLVPQEVGYFVPEAPEKRISNSRPSSGLVAQFEDVVVDSRGYIYCTEPQRGVSIYESPLVDPEA